MDWRHAVRLFASCCLASCFVACRSNPPEGIYACTSAKQCPSGWFCRVDGFCYLTREGANASTTNPQSTRDAGGDVTGEESEANGSPAVFSLSEPCAEPGQRGCSAFDSTLPVACRGGKWNPSESCSANQRCDTRPGVTQGKCQDLVPECVGKKAGDVFCRGNDRMTCGADRVTARAEHCEPGHVCSLQGTDATCVPDTDECTANADGCDNDPDACVNLLGSYECRCPQYFTGEGKGPDGCADVKECEVDNGGCAISTATCHEVIGGPPTCVCPKGYEGGTAAEGCNDIDECARGVAAVCGAGGVGCLNKAGGYTCTCAPGFHASDSGACMKDKSCADGLKAVCGEGATVCTDQSGGYKCECDAFHILEADQRSCRSRWEPVREIMGLNADSVATDGRGHVVIVGHAKSSGTQLNISAVSYDPASGWSQPVVIGPDADSSEAEVVMNGSGSALAIWSQSNADPSSTIWSRSYVVGAGWSEPVKVDSSGSGGYFALAVDTAGTAILVYLGQRNSAGTLLARQYVPATGWSAETILDPLGFVVRRSVAVDSSGNAIAVWERRDGDESTIWISHYTRGGSWGTPINLSSAKDCHDPSVALNATGTAHVIWTSLARGIQAARYVAGKGWDAEVQIDPNHAYPDWAPLVSVDRLGNAVALWWQRAPEGGDVYANRYTVDGGWGTSTLLEDSYSATWLDLAVNNEGNALAIWGGAERPYTVSASRYVVGKGWSESSVLAQTGGPPRAAIDASERVLVAWKWGFQSWITRLEQQ